ncbi:MAG: flagellar hook-length control protein FliK, partial [Sarcina sp.]
KYDGNMKVSKEFDNVLKNFTEVKVELSEKQEVMKEIIKGIVEKVSVNDGATNIISTMLKDRISDFKIFNDFSNEYYYLDVPLKLNDEYPCKLIIKDQRKDGKELDSKNIKLVINIKTLKLGDVDALIDVNQSDIKVNIKVFKKNMKILEKNSEKLHKALELLGFMPYILVSEKKEIEDKSLSEYREFFNDTSILAIDRKV